MNTTYKLLLDNCFELQGGEVGGGASAGAAASASAAGGSGGTEASIERTSNIKSLEFWHKLAELVVSVIEEDTKSLTIKSNKEVSKCKV